MFDAIKAACGSTHLWVLLINLAITGVVVGIAWGSLNADVGSLHRDIDRMTLQQQLWNAEEHRVDDLHRDRMNAIERQIFDLLTGAGRKQK